MNKLRPGSIARVDPREDGKLRMSNVTKFLASCSANGLPPEDLFHRDDLIEATSDSLARVARTIIALVKWAETPVTKHSHILRGGGKLKSISTSVAKPGPNGPAGSPYRTGSSSLAVMSSPNLSAHSPPHSPSSPTRTNTRRWTPPPAGLPTLRPVSPDTASLSSDAATAPGTETDGHETPTRTSDRDEVPPILPPRSPLRSRPSERSLIASSALESPLAQSPSYRQSARASIADSTTNQSIASSNLTDITTYSSLLDAGIGNARSSGAYGKFGTIRTVTTEATSFIPSEWPSMTRTEASAVAASISACDDNGDGNNHSPSTGAGGIVLNQRRRSNLESPVRLRERRPSETVPVDLLRVVEESEEPTSGGGNSSRGVASAGRLAPANGRIERINLKQGKWPDDFLDALQPQNYVPSRPIAIKKPSRTSLSASADAPPSGHDEFAFADPGALSTSASPSPNLEPYLPSSPTVRRPTHRARHSVDTPMLAPRDSLLTRDSSPDPGTLGSGLPSSARVVPRRNSTRSGIAGQRNGIYMPRRSSLEDGPSKGVGETADPSVAIPFPRAVSGEYVPSPSSLNAPSPLSDSIERISSNERGIGTGTCSVSVSDAGSRSTLDSAQQQQQPPPPPRGRFQSEVDGASSRRRPRPSSYDEFGAKPRRSRFESMVNLGVASGANASASDLMARDATEGSVSRQTLVMREEGKSPTHFVSVHFICGGGEAWILLYSVNSNSAIVLAAGNLDRSIARLT
jgi:hypothetical protein